MRKENWWWENRMEEKHRLIWKDMTSEVELECFKKIEENKRKMVYLVEEKEKRINMTLEEFNYIIEGDNLFALECLFSVYKNKIDFIYIDPPYNTNVFNSKYNDLYEHSIWLSFMKKRIELAKELLKDSGVIFISIDDTELCNLRILCDSIFGEKNRINRGMIIWSIPGSPKNFDYIIKSHEYILAYCNDINSLKNLFRENYPSYIREVEASAVMTPSPKNPTDTICFKAGTRVSDIENGIIEGKAGIGKTALKIEEGQIIIKEGKLLNDVHLTGSFQINDIIREYYENIEIGEPTFDRKGQEILEIYLDRNGSPIYRKAKNIEVISSLPKDLPTSGVKDLKKVLPNANFNNPKPIRLIQELLKYFCPRKGGIILDFFAGSGTTGHAVLEMNKIDNGDRKFILCTSNENNICSDICYPRLKNLIIGYNINGKEIKGIPANLIYQKVQISEEKYEDGKLEVLLDKNKKKVGNYLIELLKIKETCHNILKIKDKEHYEYFNIYCNKNITKIVFVCFGFSEKFTPEQLQNEIDSLPNTNENGDSIEKVYYLPEEFSNENFKQYNYPDDIFNDFLLGG
jgi:adenine-specific DNA-methyltransferase